MKKTICIFGLAFLSAWAVAQDEFDAVRVASSDIVGTARYVGMSGAFSALGGDVSAIKDNPAAAGVFRTSEVSMTMNFNTTLANSKWNGNVRDSRKFSTPFSQATYVANLTQQGKTKGLVSQSFAFQYDRLKTFNRRVAIQGGASLASMTDFMATYAYGHSEADYQYDSGYNPYDHQGWLPTLGYQGYLINPAGDDTWSPILEPGETVIPYYFAYESGSINNFGITWGGNFGNRLYVGVGLNILSMNYSLSSIYKEEFGAGGGFTLDNSFQTNGVGMNAAFGIIARPINLLRLSVAVQTPTVWTLSNTYDDVSLRYDSYSIADSAAVSGTTNAGSYGYSDYEMYSPFKLNAGAAFVFGKIGLLSLEYGYENYRNMCLMERDGDTELFGEENSSIRNTLRDRHTVKLGAEVKPTNNWAVRAGVAVQTPATKTDAARLLSNMWSNSMSTDVSYWKERGTGYASCGVGYRGSWWYLDLAYQYRASWHDFYAFDATIFENQPEAASVLTQNHNAVVTLGLKF